MIKNAMIFIFYFGPFFCMYGGAKCENANFWKNQHPPELKTTTEEVIFF